MPKLRQTCTRCSMRRQKCDRKSPCSRCIQNKEGHLCTTQWTNGYNPSVHRKYPKKELDARLQAPDLNSPDPIAPLNLSQQGQPGWPDSPFSGQDLSMQTGLTNPCVSRCTRTDDSIRERSFSSASSSERARPGTQETAPPSTHLDFVTFGRSDFSDISIGALLSAKDADARGKALAHQTLNQSQPRRLDEDDLTLSCGPFSAPARALEVLQLQSLLPTKSQTLQMIDYHEQFMIYWMGGVYHSPSFRKSVLEAFGHSDALDLQTQNIDWRWIGLLFSILSATVIAAPDASTTAWGYGRSEKLRLTKQWAHATISCLLLGDFASRFHIYSVQAILNLHTSEHLVGSSKEFMVYQGAAVGVARGLGLHRLGPHPEDNISSGATPEQKEALIQREMGRRTWYAMVSHDWLCSTSTGQYSIQKKHFTTVWPGYFDEESMTPVGDDIPTVTQSALHLHNVARSLIEFHDEMLDAPDLMSKYNVVLRSDQKMRALCTERVPKCMSPGTPFNPSWPRWVVWARRLHQASLYHKIIMIHQGFMPKSFKCPQFAYSRWACIDSAKQIIKHLSPEREEEEPQWWVEQAFVVTAGLCFALDLFHRSEREPETQEYLALVEKAIQLLQRWLPTSSLAAHGIRLLTSLLNERNKRIEASRPNLPSSATIDTFPNNISPAAIAHAASESSPANAIISDPEAPADPWVPATQDLDMVDFEEFMDTFPLEAGLDNNMFLENMLSIAHSEFL
ncbi:uncharacterized protein BDR25DRAFT_309625 [Lindgomyces ingoldianus]|uniref:Uncharacterized protein n=1 Tax=Lindgomyces ingoldianus TaxID=673940 RepID=A0ACB6RA93_9PLEO|nr:uncharacterized protein BDR25DRAFT_309625 [Lindgomyces ingoldianus]KAF2476189.1 hypothetical protein BDR25DRAFT_309625 [Lindgomyces ingoldianus]